MLELQNISYLVDDDNKEILRDILPNHRLFQCRWFFLLFKPFKLLYNFLFRF